MGGDDDDPRLPPSNPNESSDGNWSIYSLEVPSHCVCCEFVQKFNSIRISYVSTTKVRQHMCHTVITSCILMYIGTDVLSITYCLALGPGTPLMLMLNVVVCCLIHLLILITINVSFYCCLVLCVHLPLNEAH